MYDLCHVLPPGMRITVGPNYVEEGSLCRIEEFKNTCPHQDGITNPGSWIDLLLFHRRQTSQRSKNNHCEEPFF